MKRTEVPVCYNLTKRAIESALSSKTFLLSRKRPTATKHLRDTCTYSPRSLAHPIFLINIIQVGYLEWPRK